MIKNKKVIVFDMDGTLIDSIGIWNDIDKELIQTLGTVPMDNVDIGKQRDTKLKEYRKCADAYLEYCSFLKKKYNMANSKEEIKQSRYEIANNYLKEKIDYKPNADTLLKYLKEKGYILAVATTTNEHSIDIYKNFNNNIIKKAKLEDIFSVIYSKNDVEKIKPDAEVHYKILKKLNVQPNECLVVEDSLVGIEAANNANIEVVAIYDKYSDCDREKINELSQYQFDNFSEMLNYIKNELGDNLTEM